MVHMPSLENWEWGLKIFDGAPCNSHHPCGPLHILQTQTLHGYNLCLYNQGLWYAQMLLYEFIHTHPHKPRPLRVKYFTRSMSSGRHIPSCMSLYTYIIIVCTTLLYHQRDMTYLTSRDTCINISFCTKQNFYDLRGTMVHSQYECSNTILKTIATPHMRKNPRILQKDN